MRYGVRELIHFFVEVENLRDLTLKCASLVKFIRTSKPKLLEMRAFGNMCKKSIRKGNAHLSEPNQVCTGALYLYGT
ncbi:hypothetical protein RB195_005915 [Necator americanus]|uniref:Uncharacterized protein n=1 Tax=Necator americanus TaxID=51031 RepID=A0ABR1BRN3_NECAM